MYIRMGMKSFDPSSSRWKIWGKSFNTLTDNFITGSINETPHITLYQANTIFNFNNANSLGVHPKSISGQQWAGAVIWDIGVANIGGIDGIVIRTANAEPFAPYSAILDNVYNRMNMLNKSVTDLYNNDVPVQQHVGNTGLIRRRPAFKVTGNGGDGSSSGAQALTASPNTIPSFATQFEHLADADVIMDKIPAYVGNYQVTSDASTDKISSYLSDTVESSTGANGSKSYGAILSIRGNGGATYGTTPWHGNIINDANNASGWRVPATYSNPASIFTSTLSNPVANLSGMGCYGSIATATKPLYRMSIMLPYVRVNINQYIRCNAAAAYSLDNYSMVYGNQVMKSFTGGSVINTTYGTLSGGYWSMLADQCRGTVGIKVTSYGNNNNSPDGVIDCYIVPSVWNDWPALDIYGLASSRTSAHSVFQWQISTLHGNHTHDTSEYDNNMFFITKAAG